MFNDAELEKMAKEFADMQAFRLFSPQVEEIYRSLQRGFIGGARKIVSLLPQQPKKEFNLKLFCGWSISFKKE